MPTKKTTNVKSTSKKIAPKKAMTVKSKPTITSAKKTVAKSVTKPVKSTATYLSDKELGQFKELLLQRRREIVHDLEILKTTIDLSEEGSNRNTSYSQHMAEHGTDTLNKEQMFLFIQRDERYLGNIDKALGRIKNKTYGMCTVSGKPIPKSRLKAVPHTSVRIEVKLASK